MLRAAPRGSSRAPGPRNPPSFGPCPTTAEKSTLLRTAGPQVEGDLATKTNTDSRMYTIIIAANHNICAYNVFAHADTNCSYFYAVLS